MKNLLSLDWRNFVVFLNIFFICTTFIYAYFPHIPGAWRFLYPFNLANEMNIAVWWSGIIIFIAGIIAYEIFCITKEQIRIAWFVLFIVLIGLSMDEICSIHERIGHWVKYVSYTTCAIFVFFSVIALLLNKNTRNSALLISIGFMFYGLAAAQEYLEHVINWPYWLKGIRVALEEGTELFGTLTILLGLMPNRKMVVTQSSLSTFLPLIPNPFKLKGFFPYFIIGLFLNAAVIFLIYPKLDDIGRRGNPSIWYPTILLFLIACKLLWEAQENSAHRKKLLYGLSILYIISSMSCMYPLYLFIPKVSKIIPIIILEKFNVLYPVQLFGIILYLKKYKPLKKNHILLVVMLAVAIIISFLTDNKSIQLQILSIATFLEVTIFFIELSSIWETKFSIFQITKGSQDEIFKPIGKNNV